MTGLFSPDTVDGFENIRPIDKAVMLKEYLLKVEEEETRIKMLIEDFCSQAKADDDTDTDGWRLTVRYASGISLKPEISLLQEKFPDKYDLLVEEQMKAFRPSLSKTDLSWLFSEIVDKKDLDSVTAVIMVEHPVRPQFVLQAKKEGDQ